MSAAKEKGARACERRWALRHERATRRQVPRARARAIVGVLGSTASSGGSSCSVLYGVVTARSRAQHTPHARQCSRARRRLTPRNAAPQRSAAARTRTLGRLRLGQRRFDEEVGEKGDAQRFLTQRQVAESRHRAKAAEGHAAGHGPCLTPGCEFGARVKRARHSSRYSCTGRPRLPNCDRSSLGHLRRLARGGPG